MLVILFEMVLIVLQDNYLNWPQVPNFCPLLQSISANFSLKYSELRLKVQKLISEFGPCERL